MMNMPNNIFKRKDNTAKEAMRKTGFTPGKCTLSDASHLWMQSQKAYWKPGTYSVYSHLLTKYILPYWDNTKINKITDESMDNFASYLSSQSQEHALSRTYISQICATVRRILVYMNKKYHCKITVPCNPVTKRQTRQVILPDTASLTLLEKYLSDHCEEDTCLGILIAFHTGIRIGELSALTWNDINIEEEIIYIRKNLLRVTDKEALCTDGKKMTQIVQQCPKTSDSFRIVPISSKLIPFLKLYQKHNELYVVSGVKNPWAEPRTIQYRFKNILKKCGVDYFNFHMLRHAFATRCVAMGLDVKSLSEILGHSNIQITLNLYVHSTTQQKKQLMKQYDSFFQRTSPTSSTFS